ncbi:MAG: LON peptidase substrate-binding domain-containing protein [Acetobacteraceae bacterium]|nr:LON peptidase substrate-binding domain-containing protein [Acetobacteraceae bacterium]
MTNPFQPRLDELPAEFPVFPLEGVLLLPRGRLPLNIFEPRYMAMVEDALGAGRMFGMIQPDPQRPQRAQGPGLYRVGCLGRMSSFSESDDGRYLITLSGMIRFSVTEELEMRRGYRRVRAELAAFADDLAAAGELDGFDRGALLAALRNYFQHRGFDANWDAIGKMPDSDLVVTLAMVCPFEPAEKQALLEARDAAERARTLRTLLEIDTHQPAEPGQDGPVRAS